MHRPRTIRPERLEEQRQAIERYIEQVRYLEKTGQRASVSESIDRALRYWQGINDRLRLDPLDRLTRWGSDDDV